ncbi:MAG: type II toxin-antitoxin system PemK/MazF family toxin [Candidatus Binatia bacterium]
MVNRFDVFLVNLDPEPSANPKNTRPCVVISPDEINHNIQNVIIAPLSSPSAAYPTRVSVNFLNSQRVVVLDQIRTVDKIRLVKKIGEIDKPAQRQTLERLQEIFAE